MSDSTLKMILRTMIVVAIVVALGAGLVLVSEGRLVEDSLVGMFLIVVFGVLAWLVVSAQPRNGFSWVLAVLLPAVSVSVVGQAIIAATWPEVDLPLDWGIIPAEIPAGAAVVTGLSNGISTLGFFGMLTFGLLLFPDGRLPSPRWRWVAYLSGIVVVLAGVGNVYDWRPSNTMPVGSDPLPALASTIAVGIPLVCLSSLVIRYRRSDGEVRNQVKWVVWGAAIFVVASIIGIMLGNSIVTGLGFVALGTSFGVAITKYRLYDIGVVISRTFVYGTLAVFIGAVYVGIVVGVGALLDSGDEPNIWLGVAATVIIAIAFQPLRRRLEGLANRMVYGRRATRYEVLSSFSQSVAAVDPEVLGQVAKSLSEGTAATGVAIWTRRGDEFHRIASWPASEADFEAAPDGEYLEDVLHDGEKLGVVSLDLVPGQPLPHNDVELVQQVAAGLGLALRNLRLTDDLQTRVDQLRESRRRVVAVQDQTRQMMERDLHDGAQQRLVAMKIKVGLAGTMAEKQDLSRVKEILDSVKGETDLTIESLRTLARGIYPPLLESEGLGPALTAQLRRAAIPVTVQAAGIQRQPREIEATVYFCVLEAVRNAIRHARAKSVLVTLDDDGGQLTFEVRDDGIGFDPEAATDGHGLQNITDRIDAVDGSLHIESSPDHGTLVRGSVPMRQLEPA